ncbi:armadillo-type protein [Pelomyxa schiedti]|nr:armadillo-type protein [Pelomyxa schiedti]
MFSEDQLAFLTFLMRPIRGREGAPPGRRSVVCSEGCNSVREWRLVVDQLAQHIEDGSAEVAGLLSILSETVYPLNGLGAEDITRFLVGVVEHVPLSDSSLCITVCSLLHTILKLHPIVLNSTHLTGVFPWINHVVQEYPCAEIVYAALTKLVHAIDGQLADHIVSVFFKTLRPHMHNEDITSVSVYALQILPELVVKTPSSSKFLVDSIYPMAFKQFVSWSTSIFSHPWHCATFSALLILLKTIIMELKSAHRSDAQVLLQTLKSLLFIGTLDTLATDSCNELWNPNPGIEEFGECDMYGAWEIRCNALRCIEAVATTTPNIFYAYWTTFLPTCSLPLSLPGNKGNGMYHSLACDPCGKVRISAASALSTIITSMKPFMVAITSPVNTQRASFTPFSQNLSANIHSLHTILFWILAHEPQPIVLCSLLKCASALASCTPYEKLGDQILSNFLQQLVTILVPIKQDSNSVTLTQAALSCIHAVLTSRKDSTKPTETQKSLLSPCELNLPVALLPSLLNLASSPDTSVCVEAMRVIGTLPNASFSTFWRYFEEICVQVVQKLNSLEPGVRLTAVKTVEESFKAAALVTSSPGVQTQILQYWLSSTVFTACFMDALPVVRSTSISCLGHITSPGYFTLSNSAQQVFKDMCLVLSRDSNASVKTNLCKTVGSCWEFLIFDESFVHTCISFLIPALQPKSPLVTRTKACWALANLSAIVVKNSHELPSTLSSLQLRNDLVAVLSCLVSAGSDHEKVQSSAIRGIGSLLRFFPTTILGSDSNPDSLRSRALTTLVSAVYSSPFPKVQWNASYVLGTLLAANCVENSLDLVYHGLVHAMSSNPNLKTKISAVTALASPQRRELYGGSFETVLKAVHGQLAAETAPISTEQEAFNFQIYQYKQTLLQQLQDAFVHLVQLSTSSDIAPGTLTDLDYDVGMQVLATRTPSPPSAVMDQWRSLCGKGS